MDFGPALEEFSKIVAVRAPDGRVQHWPVTVAVDGQPRWRVALADGAGDEWVAVDRDVFHGFATVRKVAEDTGFRFLVVGARPEFWPTGMSSQMGGGVELRAHYPPGLRNVFRSLKSVVLRDRGYRYIFAPAPAAKVCSAAQQRAYRERWADGVRPQ